MAITPECNPAAEVQGPGPNIGDGNPIDVNVLTLPPVVIEGCVKVEDCPTGTPVRVTVQNFPAKQSVTIADGDDVAEGATTDAANTTGATGTISGKLRGIVTILANVWNSTLSFLRVGSGTAFVTGAIVANNGTVTLSTVGMGGAIVNIQGVFVATWLLEADYGDGTFRTWWGSENGGLLFSSSTNTLPRQLSVDISGITQLRVRVNPYTSGTVNVNITANLSKSPINTNLGYPQPTISPGLADNAINAPQQIQGLTNTGSPVTYRSYPFTFNGVGWDRVRGCNIFRTVQAVAIGNTVLWTPAAGKKFRIMRYMVQVTGNASLAVAGVLTVTLFDGAAGATNQTHDIFVPALALAGIGLYTSPWVDIGNGYLSVLANNVLNVNLSAALVTGNVRVVVAGTEE